MPNILVSRFVFFWTLAVCASTNDAERTAYRPLWVALASTPASYVQITSVTVEPASIHRAQKPDRATITVQVVAVGKTSNPTVTVEVATASADPPGNNLTYSKMRTVPVSKNPTILQFEAVPDTRTVQGRIAVFADIRNVTGASEVKDPPSAKSSRAEITILEP